MTDSESKSLQVKKKTEVTTPAEQTRPGLVFTPAADIFETEKEITLLADVPGVKARDLNIDLHENVLTLDGDVIREYRTGKYYRQFALSQLIDQAKIDADLKDGVLRLRLPKVEAAAPRKIAVKSA
jgi:HSP20 family protein